MTLNVFKVPRDTDKWPLPNVENFNNMLNAQFMHLKAFIDADDPELTQGAKQRYKDLIVIWSKYKTELDQIIDNDFS